MATRYWRDGRLADLSRRTSRAYEDTSEEARERLAAIFATLDDVPTIDVPRLAILASEILNHVATGAEKDVCDEFIDKVGESVISRLGCLSYEETEQLFSSVTAIWRQDSAGTNFAQPVLEAVLRKTMMTDPVVAAQLALELAVDVPAAIDPGRQNALIAVVLTQLSAWAMQSRDPAMSQVPGLVAGWKAVRPNSPELTGVAEHCANVLAETMGA